jgi:hypothetical protein
VGKSDRGSDLDGAGYERSNQNPPFVVFPAAADLKPALRDPTVVVLLADGVELHPLWMGMLDLRGVGRRRASDLPWRWFPVVRRYL